MQIYTILTALFLASTALACPNGPYIQGSQCGAECNGAQRCSTGGGNNVVRLYFWQPTPGRILVFIFIYLDDTDLSPVDSMFWRVLEVCATLQSL